MKVYDLLKASEIVKDQMKKFVGERIGTNSTMWLFIPAKKNKLNTFKNISKVTKWYHHANSYWWFIFKNPYYFAEMFNNFGNSFQYPMPPLSMSLAEGDGTLKKPNKSQFFYKNVEHRTEYVYGCLRLVEWQPCANSSFYHPLLANLLCVC